ncbi:MAG: HNH endonuclease [Candidatus Glassbacteria bacterium]|nr:HNH endonuclease [Candidatus Glassbacteria bacterium]
MNCIFCGIELPSPDFRKAAALGDCWPVCSSCATASGGARPAPRQELLRTLYAAGRTISSCAGCGTAGGGLEIHFLLPVLAGGEPGDDNLLVLCSSCHEKVHQGAGIKVGAKIQRKPPEEDR